MCGSLRLRIQGQSDDDDFISRPMITRIGPRCARTTPFGRYLEASIALSSVKASRLNDNESAIVAALLLIVRLSKCDQDKTIGRLSNKKLVDHWRSQYSLMT